VQRHGTGTRAAHRIVLIFAGKGRKKGEKNCSGGAFFVSLVTAAVRYDTRVLVACCRYNTVLTYLNVFDPVEYRTSTVLY